MQEQASGGKTRTKVIVLTVFLVALGALVIWVVVAGVDVNTRRSAEAPAEIIKVEAVSWEDSTGDRDGHKITYRYSVAEKTYDGVSDQNDWYRTGQAVKVCYNPSDPSDHGLKPAEFTCGSKIG